MTADCTLTTGVGGRAGFHKAARDCRKKAAGKGLMQRDGGRHLK